MSIKNWIVIISVLATMVATVGCKPATKHSRDRGIGRNAYGLINNNNGKFTSYQSGNARTSWGQVTSQQGDQIFNDQLYYMTLPMLSGASADEQLGYVSATANQSTNVVFWGEAPITGTAGSTSGTIDSSKARIHIEIWDSKAVQSGASPIVLHIGYDFDGYQGATGGVQGNQATLVFNDSVYGAIALQGTVNSQYFSGTMYFKNAQTNNQFYALGTFQVAACGFFVCK